MKRAMLIIFFGLPFLIIGHQPLFGQNLSGTYSIGTVTGTEDYSTISAALADLRAGTVTGDIVYDIASGTYNETIDLSSLNNGSFTITFSGTGKDLTIIHPLDSIIADKSGISLANTSNVVLKNFTLEMEDISATKVEFAENETKGIHITGAADITLENLGITNSKYVFSESTDHIASAVSLVDVEDISMSSSELSGAGVLVYLNDYKDISISDSDFSEGQSHIDLYKESNSSSEGLTIIRNTFTGPFPKDKTVGAIFLDASWEGYIGGKIVNSRGTSLTIEDNVFDTKVTGSTDDIHGININGWDGVVVKGNRIEDGSRGIYIAGCTSVEVATNQIYRTTYHGLGLQGCDNVDVINNVITSSHHPVNIRNLNNVRVVYNTFSATGTLSTLTTANIYDLDLLNNIFHVESSVNYEVYIGEVDKLSMDHNLFSGNANSYTIVVWKLDGSYTDAFLGTSLSDWQTNQILYDQNSQSFDPVFAGADDFHITSKSDYRFGTALEDITSDIDGDVRDESTGVDVGADQFLSDEDDEVNSDSSGPNDVTFELIQSATSPIIGLDLPKGNVGENLIYDMDGDGDNDFLFFAVGPAGGYQYMAYLNNGENHYQRMDLSHDFGVSGSVTRPIIRVADLNQDGINDIVLGGERPGNSIRDLGPVKVFFGDAEGQLHYQSGIVLPSTRGGEIRVEDFNGDAYPDIFLISAVKGKLYLNDGAGGFSEASLTGFTEGFVLDVAVSNPYNGGVDVIVEIFESGFKYVIYRYENGAFTEVMREFTAVNDTHSMASGDANGDGFPDLLILDADEALLYVNDQSGNYILDTSNDFDDLNSQYTYTLHFTDLNDDGAAEVVFAKAFTELAVFWNDGTGNYGNHQTYEISNVGWVTIGDLNGDGFPDFVNNGSTDVPDPEVSSDELITRVYVNNQTNAFELAQLNVFAQFRNGDIQLLDANEDGHDDLLVSGAYYQGTESITELYLNDGTGEFTLVSGLPFEGLEHASIAVADFNGDTHEDVVLSGLNQSDEVHTRLYLGDGTGSFSQDMSAGLSGVIGNTVTLDANGDDHPDLLVIGSDGADNLIAELYLNDGSGTLALHVAGLTGLDAVSVAVGDIDADDDVDILIQGLDATDADQMLVYTNNGVGNFTEATDHGLDALADGKVLLFDIDGDEDLDVYLSGGGQLLIYENDGTGDFTQIQSEEGPSRSTAEFGDIDLDGDLDLVESGKYGASEEPRTFVYHNDGNGTFTRDSVTTLHGIFDGAIAMGDLDQDQDLEIMLSGAVWDDVTSSSRIYRNTSAGATDDTPIVTSVSLAADNSYLDVTFSEGVYNTVNGSGPVEVADFSLSISGGTATSPVISSVKQNDHTEEASASGLSGGETTVRIFFTTTGIPDGAETLTINPVDASSVFNSTGQAAQASQSNNTIALKDQVAPPWPPRPVLDASTNSGADSDGHTNHTVLKITGTAEPHSLITLEGSYGLLGVTTADASGDWFVITDPQEEGNFSVSFTATDSVGNVSDRSFALGVQIDLTTPTASISRHIPNTEFYSGSQVTFLALFDENVENVDGGDFFISGPAASGASFVYSETLFFGFPIREITVSNITTEGQLNLDFNQNHGITDLAGNALNEATSINQSFTIDNTVPFVSDITASSPNGAYGSTDEITLRVNFSEAVSVTGTPTLELETGSIDQTAVYNGIGSGTSTLEFVYIVQSGDASADLDYTSPGALMLNGGTIKDVADLDATLTLPAVGASGSLAANADIVVDGASLTFISSNLAGDNSFLDVSFTEGAYSTNSSTGALEIDDFNLSISGGAATTATVTSVKKSDNVVETAASALTGGETAVRIFFTTAATPDGAETMTVNPADGSSIFDISGNPASASQINNTVILNDKAGPVIASVAIPNSTAKVGDAIPVTIDAGETGLALVSGTVNGVAVTNFAESGEISGTYTAIYTVVEGHTDRPASEDIPVNFVLIDGIGNLSDTYKLPISQNADLIDANSPSNSITIPIASDNMVNAAEDETVVISGTTVGVEDGRLVVVLFDDGENPTVRTQANVKNSAWIATSGDISGLNNGNIMVTANLSDFARNPAPEVQTIIMLDNTLPAKPAVTHISDDTGSSNTDGITSDRNLLIHGTAEADAMVEVFSPGGLIGTVQANANGDWTLDISGYNLPEMTANTTAEAIDIAGNRSAISDVFVINIDFTAPAKPMITGISDDTGSSATDGITSDRNLVIHGIAEPDAMVEVFSPGGLIGTVQTDANGDWTLDISGYNLPEMTANTTAEAIDIAGNRSATSDGFVITIDFTAPAKPVITGISDDTGSSNTDGITSDRNLMIYGKAEPDAVVEVFSPGGLIGTVQTDNNGDWTLDISRYNLPEMTANTIAEAIDIAGNRSATSDGFVINIDFTAPAKPVITGISDDTGSSATDGITNDRNLVIHGTAEADAMVEVFSPGGLIGSIQVDANGDWTLDISGYNLPEMIANTTAEAIDVAGNRSATSDAFVITIDFTRPEVTIDIVNSSEAGYLIKATFNEDVSGLTLGEITIAGGTAGSLIQTGSNTYSFLVNSLGSGANVAINANVAEDVAGNGNTPSNQLTLGFTSVSSGEGFTTLQDTKRTEDLRVTIYPTPASSWLTIDLSEVSAGQIDITFVDMSGKTIFSTNDYRQDELKVNVSAYKNGLYFVLVSREESLIRNKVLIRR